MDSSTHQNYPHQHHQCHPSNSGFLRFRSVPSSFLINSTEPVIGSSGLSNCNPCEASESRNLMSRYATCSDTTDSGTSSFHEFEEKPSPATFIEVPLKLVNPPLGWNVLPPHYPRHNPALDSSFGKVTPMGTDHHTDAKSFSSPAGPFTNIPFQNGYNTVKGFGICTGAHSNIGEVSPSMNELKSRTDCSSRALSSLGVLSQISGTVSESIHGISSPEENENCKTQFYGDGSTYGAWNDSSNFSDNFAGLKRQRSNEEKIFSSCQLESHHLSLPKASAGMISVDKFLPFQDSVPWKIRAKRGCATHPRSIAERVRRTRISERMRRLQELVPKMDKQTNTADMLDLAVEYIKDLQKQFKTLRDNRAKCTCSRMQKQVTSQIV